MGIRVFYVAEERLGRDWETDVGAYDRLVRKTGNMPHSFCYQPQAVGFYRKMGAVRDGETRSPVDGRPVPHFVYDL